MQSKYFVAKMNLEEKRVARQKESAELVASSQATDLMCPICLDMCNMITVINCCKHTFCFHCISVWGKITPTCPLCKLGFTEAKCAETHCTAEELFLPTILVDLDSDDEASNILQLDDDDNSSIVETYSEMGDFIVASEDLDSDDYEEDTEADRILDMADEVFLKQKRRKLLPHLPELDFHDIAADVRLPRPCFRESQSHADIVLVESSNCSVIGFDAFIFHGGIR